MKKIYISALIAGFLLLLFGCHSDRTRIIVRASLDSVAGAKYNGQMAYLFAQRLSRCRLIDSCRIEHNALVFEGPLPQGSWMAEIVLQDNLHTWPFLALMQGDRIELRLGEQMLFESVSGSPDMQALLEEHKATRQQGIAFRKFRDSLPGITDETLRRRIKDSMEYYALEGPVTTQILRKFIHSIQNNGYMAAIWYDILKDYSADSLLRAETANYLRRKFPDDEAVRIMLENDLEAMRTMTREDTIAWNIKNRICKRPPLSQQARRRIVKPAEHITPYRIGDIVQDFSLPGTDGQQVNLSACKAPYVLIDFWATWCGPCRREIPYLKAARKRFGDRLDIYSVSMDYDADTWKEYIRNNQLEIFTQVLMLNEHPLKPEILARFGCTAIPRNFLLDTNRRIVAIDLRGENLDQKLQELMPEPSVGSAEK